jgi:flagellar biosynthesis/type III secretory pathway M-ring protein FliF/YscJ
VAPRFGAADGQCDPFSVANSVEGLTANNVSVVDNQGNVLPTIANRIPWQASPAPTHSARTRNVTGQKAEGMLDKVLGPTNLSFVMRLDQF